jgi:hypothetical protein
VRDDFLKHINFKDVRTILTKEDPDLEEWKKCIEIPFRLLDSTENYSITYFVATNYKNYGYSLGGNIESLYNRVLEKINDASMVFIIITNKDKKKEYWLISKKTDTEKGS